MTFTSFDMQRIEKQFDSFCKKVIKRKALNIIRDTINRRKREKMFSDLQQEENNKLFVTDKYNVFSYEISAFDLKIPLENEILYKSLSKLKTRDTYILILKYWHDFTDKEISQYLNIPRTTVTNSRLNSLKKLKKYINELD